LIVEGIKHPGFALIHVLNPCPTYHDTWKEYPSKIVEIGTDHNCADLEAARELVKVKDKIPIGIIFKQNRPTVTDRLWAEKHEELNLKNVLDTYR
jgi:2-oxoglutarate ferredoxin oxidoreductase subunit beta